MNKKPINNYCPRSGKPVQSNSLTHYRGFTFGFCNQECRDDFAKNTDECIKDRQYFDTLIKDIKPGNIKRTNCLTT